MIPDSPSPPKRGRPRAINDAKRRDICALVAAGCEINAAARYIGCVASTVRREAERNPEFDAALRRAVLEARRIPLSALSQFAKTYWRTAARLREQANASTPEQPSVKFLKPERFARFIEIMTKLAPEEAIAALAAVLPSGMVDGTLPPSDEAYATGQSEAERAKIQRDADDSYRSAQNPHGADHDDKTAKEQQLAFPASESSPRSVRMAPPLPADRPASQSERQRAKMQKPRSEPHRAKMQNGSLNSHPPPREYRIPQLGR